MKRVLTQAAQIERSIFKKYKKELWAPFLTALTKYELLQENDHVAVCISGGKDSMLMALLFQNLQKHSDFSFSITYLMMDPGYNKENRQRIEENAQKIGIPLTIFETDIFEVANNQDHSPCYLCARMRRGHLYNKAKELGCNKIALGHHLNDVIETAVMSMFYSSKLETMIPKVHSKNFEGMELIRPMYCIKEKDIIAWSNYNDLHFIQCACRFTEIYKTNHNKDRISKRQETKDLIKSLQKDNPEIEDNIFRALHAVYIETFPGFKSDNTLHSFLELYNQKKSE